MVLLTSLCNTATYPLSDWVPTSSEYTRWQEEKGIVQRDGQAGSCAGAGVKSNSYGGVFSMSYLPGVLVPPQGSSSPQFSF